MNNKTKSQIYIKGRINYLEEHVTNSEELRIALALATRRLTKRQLERLLDTATLIKNEVIVAE